MVLHFVALANNRREQLRATMDSDDTEMEPGGYDVTLVSSLPHKLKCPICNLLMRDPVQTFRGEKACASCYGNTKGNNSICPLDKEPIENDQIFKDRHTQREILQLQCYCSNKYKGCNWEGVVQHTKDHLLECVFTTTHCERCSEYILRKDNEEHATNLCRFRKINCTYCNLVFDAQSMQEHESTCTLKPVKCPYICGEHIALKDVYTHVVMCPKIAAGTMCPFQLMGCEYQPKSQDELNHHLQTNNRIHAALTTTVLNYQKQNTDRLNQELMTEQTIRIELANKIEEQTIRYQSMESELTKTQDKLSHVEKEYADIKEFSDSTLRKMEDSIKEMDLRLQENSLSEINAKLTEISKQYENIESKIGSRIADSSPIMFDAEEIKKGAEAVDQLESKNAVLTANLSDLELKLQLLENTGYSGQQLWKVDNVAYRMNQAVTGKITALHSAPCFQNRGGYKFCSRLYLNGDGMGRGTHVSLFFVMMKSEYDALLEWPFSQRVTFRLINPYDRDRSIRESFIPDRNSSSFRRPTKEMNIAAGCPMFIRKEDLDAFLVDDVLYIETVITTS